AVPWRVFSAAGFQERNCQAPHLPGAGSEAAVPGRTPHAHDRRLRHGRPERRPGHGRGGYRRSAVDDMKEVAGLLAFPGFWRVMRNHPGSAVTELKNSLWRRGYLAECRKFCPELTLDDLSSYPAGVRAQAVLRDGTLVHDFAIRRTKRTLHVCNA